MDRQEPQGPPPAYQPTFDKNYAEPYNQNTYGPQYGFTEKPGYEGQYPPNQYPYSQQYGQQQQAYGQQPVYQQPGPYMQPTYLYASPLPQCTGPPPKSYSVFAWLSCLFCCWPLGLVAICKSCEVTNAVSQGDMDRAKKASDSARKLSVASVFCGVGAYLVGFIFLVFFAILIPDASRHHYS